MGKYLKGRPWLTELADNGDIPGECANCGKIIYADQRTLDDAYGVWRGVCPHCEAVNLLASQKMAMRGYTSKKMFLVLPTDHEMKMNNWTDTEITSPCACKECSEQKP